MGSIGGVGPPWNHLACGLQLVHIRTPARCLVGADADPLGVRSAIFGGFLGGFDLAVLFVILGATIALSIRAGLVGRSKWRVADSDNAEDSWLLEACARTFVLVFLSLLGLFALGLMYGNVLGATNVANP